MKRHGPGRLASASLVIGLVLAACSVGSGRSTSPSPAPGRYPGWPGGGGVVGSSDLIPRLVNNELAVGTRRIMVLLEDRQGVNLTSPDLAVQIGLYDLAASTATAVTHATGTFRWLIPDTKAIYTAPADFTHAGDWGLEVTTQPAGQAAQTARLVFSVRDRSATPAIGDSAPLSDTLTATDPGTLSAISTDAHPDPAFYRLSVREAVAAGKPFVLVFATPLFCTSGTCGPALDLVKQVAPAYAGRVNFIHVEPYVLHVQDGQLQPVIDVTGYPKPVRAVVEWGLPSEPFVFVVDARGKVAAKFEGMAYPDELTAALDALLP